MIDGLEENSCQRWKIWRIIIPKGWFRRGEFFVLSFQETVNVEKIATREQKTTMYKLV